MRVMRSTWSGFLPHQGRAFAFDPPMDPSEPDRRMLEILALLGGWGSAKTEGTGRKFVKVCAENGWTPDYGGDNPIALMMAPTARTLRNVTIKRFLKLCPRELILKVRKSDDRDITLINGLQILPVSFDADLEGITAVAAWISEIHLMSAVDYLNVFSRVRDPLARRRAVLVDGLPFAGWVREQFDTTAPGHLTILAGINDNPYLSEDYRQKVLKACPKGEEDAYLWGKWMTPQGLIYKQFDTAVHLTDQDGDPRAPVHLGLDLGDRSSLLVGQETRFEKNNLIARSGGYQEGLLIVDELVPRDESLDQICTRFKIEKDWPRVKTVCGDPTMRREEIAIIRRHFPGARIVQRKRGDDKFPVETGIRITQAALMDASGNTRLKFHRRLKENADGVIDGLQAYERNPQTGHVKKNNANDHACDALRYLACEFCPTAKPMAPRLV